MPPKGRKLPSGERLLEVMERVDAFVQNPQHFAWCEVTGIIMTAIATNTDFVLRYLSHSEATRIPKQLVFVDEGESTEQDALPVAVVVFGK